MQTEDLMFICEKDPQKSHYLYIVNLHAVFGERGHILVAFTTTWTSCYYVKMLPDMGQDAVQVGVPK